MSKTCPQCHANLGYMERGNGHYCINCESVFVDSPDEWSIYSRDYGVFNR